MTIPRRSFRRTRRSSSATSITTTSSASSRATHRSTSVTTSRTFNSQALTLTPATSLSTIAEDKADHVPPSEDAVNDQAVLPISPGSDGKLTVEQIEDLKTRSTSTETYSPDGECTASEACQLVRTLLAQIGDYSKTKRPPIETKEDKTGRIELVEKHFTKVDQKWRCKICNTPGSNPFAKLGRFELAKHLRIHLCREHKPFRCYLKGCKHVDTQKSNMLSHLNMHTGETVKCDKCGEKLRNPTAKNRHLLKKCPNVVKPEGDKGDEHLSGVSSLFGAPQENVEDAAPAPQDTPDDATNETQTPVPQETFVDAESNGLAPEATSDSTKNDVSTPQDIVDNRVNNAPEPQVTVDSTDNDAPEPQVTVDNTENDAPESQVTVDNTENDAPEPQVTVDNTENDAPEPQVTVDNTENVPFAPQDTVDNTENGAPAPQNIVDNAENETPAPQDTANNTENDTQSPEYGSVDMSFEYAINGIPAKAWSWSMLRSNFTFDENLGKLQAVPKNTCVFDFKPPSKWRLT
ncbi:hypothetical protein BDY19DRAFT_309492 [Irpex rosettiformis]|uniref:Uncharacterized protein n=1 Tax=Irpex rosettiformis TaxID=378272 RepID=A0ACB8TZ57_9APHY|nr:hypothetical protein BDY19DRAFT_309492 [Irpex rosettiformis]